MKLPGKFEKQGLPDFDGVVWFRKTITLTADQASAKASLQLGQIDDMDVTWVNGTRGGSYKVPGHHFTLRAYSLSAGVLREGRNTIAVRVLDHGAGGGIAGKPEQLTLRLGTKAISLATSWRFAPGANLAALTGMGHQQHPTSRSPKVGRVTGSASAAQDKIGEWKSALLHYVSSRPASRSLLPNAPTSMSCL